MKEAKSPSPLPSLHEGHSRCTSVGRLSKRPSMQLDQGDGWYLMSDYSEDGDFPVDESFLAMNAAKQSTFTHDTDTTVTTHTIHTDDTDHETVNTANTMIHKSTSAKTGTEHVHSPLTKVTGTGYVDPHSTIK